MKVVIHVGSKTEWNFSFVRRHYSARGWKISACQGGVYKWCGGTGVPCNEDVYFARFFYHNLRHWHWNANTFKFAIQLHWFDDIGAKSIVIKHHLVKKCQWLYCWQSLQLLSCTMWNKKIMASVQVPMWLICVKLRDESLICFHCYTYFFNIINLVMDLIPDNICEAL